jgi:hypothetical protein
VAKAKGSAATSDVDRLIEMGLNRYGAGDLDGAIFLWEEALAVDPENTQATSYIDYVRLNFDILTGEPSIEEPADAPHVIVEDPEYQIELVPGDPSMPPMPLAAAMISLDPVDEGWFADEQTHDSPAAPPSADDDDDDSESGTIELEAGEPIEMEADEPPASALNFDAGETRKYHGDVQQSSEPMLPEPDDLDSGYGTAGPTTGFFRDDDLSKGQTMGYFREDEATSYETREDAPATKPEPPPADTDENEFGDEPATGGFNPQGTPLGFSNLETEIRKRDFGFVQPTAAKAAKEPAPIAIGSAPTEDRLGFDATQEHDPFMGNGADEPADPSADDLLDSLPTPRPVGSQPESGEIQLSPSPTLDFPETSRAPARHDAEALSQAEVMLPHAQTKELSIDDLRARAHNPIISAPTRELGLRPGGRPLSNPDDDDAPTGQSDVRAIREATTRQDGAVLTSKHESTRHDIVLQFDPIAAASAQILDDIDVDAPPGESLEDQTRRRITRLLEKAGDWSEAGDLDKAVSAVDLALSEDANSALAQKLITRNKDTIMSLFQAYLGDLDRTPQLAKPLHELSKEPISPRAAFLLSRIDGMLTIDELLDVSGMPRMEAYRHLCQLFLRGILR